MEFIKTKIQMIETEIELRYKYIEDLKNIENDRQLIFKLRNDILNEYNLKCKTKMGKLNDREVQFNNEMKIKTNSKLELFDDYFNLTKDEVKKKDQTYRFEIWFRKPS